MTSTPAPSAAGPVWKAGPPSRRLRASDADRAAMVARLQEAVGRGLLTLDEGDERMASAFAARYVDELAPLTADLPAPAPGGPAAVGWRQLGEAFVDQLRAELQMTAAAGVRSRRFAVSAFAVLLFVLLVLAMVAAVLHGAGGPGDFYRHPFGPGR